MNAVLKTIYKMQVGNDNDIIIVIKLWLYTSLIYELEFWMYSVTTRLVLEEYCINIFASYINIYLFNDKIRIDSWR